MPAQRGDFYGASTCQEFLRLQPKDPRECRILELGCAGGGNLLPMALALPESEFVGIDGSSVQVAEGEEAIRELNITNLKLYAMDVLDFPADMGTFHYVICHGVYSWVPNRVKRENP
jgi:tRNA G46 methylase TrmB